MNQLCNILVVLQMMEILGGILFFWGGGEREEDIRMSNIGILRIRRNMTVDAACRRQSFPAFAKLYLISCTRHVLVTGVFI